MALFSKELEAQLSGLGPPSSAAAGESSIPGDMMPDGAAPVGGVEGIIRTAADKYGVDPDIMVSLAKRESSLNPNARNKGSTAGGLFQFLDGTWRDWGHGEDKFDPVANADAGARMLRANLDRFGGDYNLALAAHHVGPGMARKALSDASVGDKDVSTQKWLADVLGGKRSNGAIASDSSPSQAGTPRAVSPWDSQPNYRDAGFSQAAKDEEKRIAIAEEGLWDAAKHGFGEATNQIPQMAAGAGAALGDLIGWDSLRDAGLAYVRKANDAAAEEARPYASFSDAMESGDMLRWMAYATGYGVNQIAQSFATGGAGAMLGKVGLTGLLKGTAARTAADLVAKGATKEVAAKAGMEAAQIAAQKYGAAMAMSGYTYGQELGSIYPDAVEQAEKTGDPMSLAKVYGAAGVAAALEVAPEIGIAGKLIDGAGKGSKNLLGRAAVTVPKQMGLEGGTEYAQTGVEQWGANKPLDTEEAAKERLDSAAMGAIMGVGTGGVEAIPAPREKPAAPPPNSPLSAAAAASGATPGVAPAIDPATGAPLQPGQQPSTADVDLKGLFAQRDSLDQTIQNVHGQMEMARQQGADEDAQQLSGRLQELTAQRDALTQHIGTATAFGAANPAAEARPEDSAPDPMADRLKAVAPIMEDKALFAALRSDERYGREAVTDALAAYAKARNPLLEPISRAWAMQDVEDFVGSLGARDSTGPGGGAEGAASPEQERHNQPTPPGPSGGGALRERDFVGQPSGSFGNLAEFEDLLGQERADAEQRRGGIADRQALRRDVETQDADARVQDQRERETVARRRKVLDAILSDPSTKNPHERFFAELKRQGFSNPVATLEEMAAIARFEGAKATFGDDELMGLVDQERAELAKRRNAQPSSPNELDPYEQRQPRKQNPPKSRITPKEVQQHIADGATLDGTDLVMPEGERIGLEGNVPALAAARNAVKEKKNEAHTQRSLPSGVEIDGAFSGNDGVAKEGQAAPPVGEVAQGSDVQDEAATDTVAGRPWIATPQPPEQPSKAADNSQGESPQPAAKDRELIGGQPNTSEEERKAAQQAKLYAAHPDFLQADLEFVSQKTGKPLAEVRAAYDGLASTDVSMARLKLARTVAQLRGDLPQGPAINSEIDAAAHEAATSPHNDKPQPTESTAGKPENNSGKSENPETKFPGNSQPTESTAGKPENNSGKSENPETNSAVPEAPKNWRTSWGAAQKYAEALGVPVKGEDGKYLKLPGLVAAIEAKLGEGAAAAAVDPVATQAQADPVAATTSEAPPSEPSTVKRTSLSEEAKTTPAAPSFEGVRLDQIPPSFMRKHRVMVDVFVEETKRVHEVEMAANEAIQNLQAELDGLQALLNCVKG